MGENTYTRDAYVIEVPEGWSSNETHFIMIDLMESDGTVRHQAIAGIFGKNNAEHTCADINRWREETKVQ